MSEGLDVTLTTKSIGMLLREEIGRARVHGAILSRSTRDLSPSPNVADAPMFQPTNLGVMN